MTFTSTHTHKHYAPTKFPQNVTFTFLFGVHPTRVPVYFALIFVIIVEYVYINAICSGYCSTFFSSLKKVVISRKLSLAKNIAINYTMRQTPVKTFLSQVGTLYGND